MRMYRGLLREIEALQMYRGLLREVEALQRPLGRGCVDVAEEQRSALGCAGNLLN